jgi:hypothetical protein
MLGFYKSKRIYLLRIMLISNNKRQLRLVDKRQLKLVD